jgi:hypothetical protein
VVGKSTNYCDPAQPDKALIMNKWNNRYTPGTTHLETYLCDTYTPASNYDGPSQSPDGTKVLFPDSFLNNDTAKTYLTYVVAYYPYPPQITATTATGGTVTVRGDWGTNSGTWRGYTQRKWVDESTGTYLPPREINKWRLWRSPDKTTWTPITTVTANTWDRYNFKTGVWTGNTYWDLTDAPGNGTWYYALTSIETSGLESRALGNIFAITVSGGSGTGAQDTAYPASPGGKSNFYTTAPSSPQTLTVTHKKTPATADGQYTLDVSFTPADTDKHINVYALDNTNPTAVQQRRIASIAAGYFASGSGSWVDWLGKADGSTKYGITKVDTQGNESTIKLFGSGNTYNESLGLSIKGFFDKHLRGAGMGVSVN